MAGDASGKGESMKKQHNWHRSEFISVWQGPDIELLVLQNGGSSEDWRWTARGWREPEYWSEAFSTREKAEEAALVFYLDKE